MACDGKASMESIGTINKAVNSFEVIGSVEMIPELHLQNSVTVIFIHSSYCIPLMTILKKVTFCLISNHI